MAQHAIHGTMHPTARPASSLHSPSYQAYQLLHVAFVLVPVLAGADKFFGVLTNWQHYLAPSIAQAVPGAVGVRGLMMLVGIIEIAAGFLVAVRPRVGAFIVAAWLVALVVNLVLGGFFDIALRDAGLCLGAMALGRLSDVFDRPASYEERREVVVTSGT